MGWELFGDALRERRAQTGLSQRALAARAGVSERSVRNIESGAVQRPQRDVARRLAEAVDLDLSVLPAANGSALRIGVLGPFVAEAGTEPADVGPAKQRALLGLLALQPGVAVSTEEIIDAVWGENPPASSVNLVHTYSSRLRRALESYQSAVRVLSTRGGYRLLADAESLDLWRFRDLVDRAARADDPQVAVDQYEQALDCWRGRIAADLPAGVRRHPAAAEAERRRLAAVLAYADAALGVGRCDVERLRRLADVEPLHEGLHARLMLALAGDGQQAAALRVFDDLRRRLRDELGIDPGAELRDAQLRVLRGDSSAGVERVVAGHPKPAELPADVGGYVGRGDELARLDAMLDAADEALVITSIDGMPGVGKTALAVHWAHRVAGRFPDGQLYINLRGYDRTVPVQPQQALARFLRALGVAADRIPADEDEAASLYRSLLAERRVLVVLDNASSVDQVRPLLPGSSSCFVVVTSRDRLTELAAAHGTQRLTLDVLQPDEAHTLVAGMIGQESDAVDELAQICGYLPLVLRVAAANLSVQPHSSAAKYVADMRERGKLAGNDAVRAAFDVSYELLPPAARDVFPLLGLAPGDFTPDVAAALADCTVPAAVDVLQQLCAASLLQEHTAGRFRLHDLLREYAATRAAGLDNMERTAALTRMLDFYLRSVHPATRLLYPNVLRSPLPDASEAPHAVSFRSDDTALAWLDTERTNILEAVTCAAELGAADHAWRLVDALRGYLLTRGHNAEALAACSSALDVAHGQGDRLTEALILDVLGSLYFNLSDYERARAMHDKAHAIGREVGDRAIEANSLHNLGRVYSQLGTAAEAARCYREAMMIRRSIGDVMGEIWSLSYLGSAALSQADLSAASDYNKRALQLARSSGDRLLEGLALHTGALIHWSAGRLAESAQVQTESLRITRAVGNRHCEVAALVCLAETYCDAGRYVEAEEAALDALTLARSLGERRQEVGSLEILAAVRHHTGRPDEAESLYLEALKNARDIRFSYGEESVLIRLAALYRQDGRPAEAVTSCEMAVAIMSGSGAVSLESRALAELALGYLGAERATDAVDSATRALDVARVRGQSFAEALALRALGLARLAQGEQIQGRRCLKRAWELFSEIGTPEAADVRDLLAGMAHS